MFKLISKTDVIPSSLFITNVKTDFSIIGAVGIGGYGRVFRGEHEGRTVALKILDKARKNVGAHLVSFLTILIRSISILSVKTFVRKLWHGDRCHIALSSLYWEYLKTKCDIWCRP